MIRLLAAIACLAAPAAAQTASLGDIRIEAPMLRDAPPGAPVGAGYVTIRNVGAEDDALVSAGVDAGVAAEVQLHEMTMTGGTMTMSAVAGGIVVPAGGTVTLAPGGLHLMLMRLGGPLTAGGDVAVTLTFERAGTVDVAFPVVTLGQIRAAGTAGRGGMHGIGYGVAAPAGRP